MTTLDKSLNLLSFFQQLDKDLKDEKYQKLKCNISQEKIYKLGMITDEVIKYLLDRPQFATLLSIYALIASKLDAVYEESLTIEEFIYMTNMVHNNSQKVMDKINSKNGEKNVQYG